MQLAMDGAPDHGTCHNRSSSDRICGHRQPLDSGPGRGGFEISSSGSGDKPDGWDTQAQGPEPLRSIVCSGLPSVRRKMQVAFSRVLERHEESS